MARLEGEVLVQKSRREVYAYLLDMSTRGRFWPEEFGNFKLTSPNPFGVGGSVGFDVKLGKLMAGHITLSGVLPPEGITEIGRAGDLRWTLRWAMEERDDGTAVRIIMEYGVSSFLKKPLELLVYAPAAKRWHASLLARFKREMESESATAVTARSRRASAGYVGAQW